MEIRLLALSKEEKPCFWSVAKTEGLTEAETAERKALREEYIAAYRKNLRTQLDNMVIVEPNGERRKLKPKK